MLGLQDYTEPCIGCFSLAMVSLSLFRNDVTYDEIILTKSFFLFFRTANDLLGDIDEFHDCRS